MTELTSSLCLLVFLIPVAAALLILLLGRWWRMSAFLAVLKSDTE